VALSSSLVALPGHKRTLLSSFILFCLLNRKALRLDVVWKQYDYTAIFARDADAEQCIWPAAGQSLLLLISIFK